MTLRELIEVLGGRPWLAAAALAAVPLLTFVLGFAHRRDDGGASAFKYLYSVLVYLACVPGMLAAVLTGYTLLFSRTSLLDVDPVVYLLPIATMVTTLGIMSRRVAFEDVPGFDRLSAFMLLLGLTFVILLAVDKTRIWLLFGGGFVTLLVLGAAVFGLLRWGTYMLFRRSTEPRIEPPSS